MLGADILTTLSSSGDSFPDYALVDAERFLRLTSDYYPSATLALGWTVNPQRYGNCLIDKIFE